MYLGVTNAIVEGSSYIELFLWQRWSDSIKKSERHRVPWTPSTCGFGVQLGTIEGMAITMSMFWTQVDHCWLCFWDMPSAVSDTRMSDNFFDTLFPGVYRGSPAHFGSVLTEARKSRDEMLEQRVYDMPE